MSGTDAELDLLRGGVSCAALLERHSSPWRLDRRESTRRALKYRRGEGEVLIVNHDGRGWWDPQGQSKGDVFDLVQYLEPGLNFGRVRQVLRPLVGISATLAAAARDRRLTADQPVADRWSARPRLRPGSGGWGYLFTTRRIPAVVLEEAAAADAVRDGFAGSAWFAHRDETERVVHVEARGHEFKGSLRGGTKVLFRFGGQPASVSRIVVTEAPIDALSVATLEGLPQGTIYVATGGGMGPNTEAALNQLCIAVSEQADAALLSAADANIAGDRFAERHAAIAASAGITFGRLRPPIGDDWNDTLRAGGAP